MLLRLRAGRSLLRPPAELPRPPDELPLRGRSERLGSDAPDDDPEEDRRAELGFAARRDESSVDAFRFDGRSGSAVPEEASDAFCGRPHRRRGAAGSCGSS